MVDQQNNDAAVDRLAQGYCAGCSYDLRGLPTSGACPECAQQYTSNTVLERPRPSAFRLVLLFCWPLAIAAALFVSTFMLANLGTLAFVIILGFIFLVVTIVNSLACGFILTRRRRRIINSQGRFGARLHRLGTLAVVLFYTTLILALLPIGGCLLMIVGDGL